MVTSSHIAPNPILSAYVVNYTLRQFETDGLDIKRPWFASYQTSITFFFKDKPINLRDPIHGKVIKKGDCINILGLNSEYNGEMTFNGSYLFFEMAFRPTGLHDIFGIPAATTLNHIVDGRDLLDINIQVLYERLCEAKNIREMGLLADTYLLNYLLKRNQLCDNKNFLKIVSTIINSFGKPTLDQLTFQANMSNRNLERQFIDKVGVSPKHLICMVRFNLALSYKRRNPTLNWTSIAAECGYFDQMHMIREFKHLSGNTPSDLIKIPLVTGSDKSSHLSTSSDLVDFCIS
ncbi:helix-turn-helix domain-containing protein [Gelidibacter gilvus]|uniref:AraC family transcriptional regulator n=1 Tax=Gelidibacter gilvus TaxID=59602 RepID=A0A4V1LMR5_9FLAO|nr:AraC family transcriptional regulator [Gelidibacter gilvus]RXJ49416.1 AraC family transcriptional regulator [Gelidibacter gilvus]